MIRVLRFAVVAAGIGLLALPQAASAGHKDVSCTAPDQTVRLKTRLPNTARAIRRGRELTIVAIGSSSTVGVGASDTAHSYPSVLADELRLRWPALRIRMINKGVNGETADQMLARFDRDVLPFRPQLVIWQAGSNSAIRNPKIDEFAETVRSGIKRLRAWRTDVILMDPQYAPIVIAAPIHRRVVDSIGAVANDLKVSVFHRYGVMRHWVDSGRYKVEDLVAKDRLHMNDVSYGCIARLLADSLGAAASATPPSPAEGAAGGRL